MVVFQNNVMHVLHGSLQLFIATIHLTLYIKLACDQLRE